jgi:hypothetical protein
MKKLYAVVAIAVSLSSFGPITEAARAETVVTTTKVLRRPPVRVCRTVVTTRRVGLRVVRTSRRICR